MKHLIPYGTYDPLRYGHIDLPRRAEELGDYVIAALFAVEFSFHGQGPTTSSY